VAALIVERHRDVRDDLVDDLLVGAGLAEQGVLPAPALDEFCARVLGGKIPDGLFVLRDRVQAGEHDVEKLVRRPVGRVAVAIDEAGQHHASLQVDHRGLAADVFSGVTIAADKNDLAIPDGNGRRDGSPAIDRINEAVL
jgi:hypothetical protein